MMKAQKFNYVYQGYDGKIYGNPLCKTPQEIGRINAQNRRDGTYGSWIRNDYLTVKELANRASDDDLAAFSAKCHFCGK